MSHPERLGKYPIICELGKGAMGVVYKAFDPVINRPVAIKTIHKTLRERDLSGTSTTDRFKNEARAVGRLSHPGIVAIYEYGEDADEAFIAMEYVEGRTLSQILAARPRPPEADVLTLMDQLLAALDCAHRAGVWHRDIKPANLIVTHAGQLKVTDFGIARIESVALTQITSVIGTQGYMAPELYVGQGVDHRVDIFAAGVLLYHMLVGHLPFRGTAENVMYQVLHEDPVPPSQVAQAGRHAFYDAIISKALAKSPELRFASAAEFREALSRRAAAGADTDAEATVIAARPGSAPPPAAYKTAAGGWGPSPSEVERSLATTMIAGWDDATLHEVELALASFIGPMAKVLVRQAARGCRDLNVLTSTVGAHLPNDQDRQRFMAKLSDKAALSQVGTPLAPGAEMGVQLPAGPRLSPKVIAVALRVLTKHMGPIASVMIKKAIAKEPTTEEFFQLLANHVDAPERERVLAELRHKP